ncbi:MAG TPA: CBS domain-containing protein [Acidimicrobiia bacterium]|jgi:CBS domain-containing protein|nr:CBS domain-containing protein [Acidimicrobiia bacterium]
MRLGDLVGNAPYVCGPDTTLLEAAAAMESSDLGSLAVVEGMSLLGLITERDIRRAVATGIDLETAVSALMSGDPDTFDPDLDVWDAAAWIVESGYRHLPVVGDEGELQGVVSIRDLLKALVDTV